MWFCWWYLTFKMSVEVFKKWISLIPMLCYQLRNSLVRFSAVRLHYFKIDTNSLSLSVPLPPSYVLPQCYLCTAFLIFLPVFVFSFCVSVNEQLKWIAVLTTVLPFAFLLCLYFFITSTFYSLCTQIWTRNSIQYSEVSFRGVFEWFYC